MGSYVLSLEEIDETRSAVESAARERSPGEAPESWASACRPLLRDDDALENRISRATPTSSANLERLAILSPR